MASEVNRRVAKAVALFSSMQVVQVVCAMVRTKFIAMWLGKSGVGLMGLYLTVVDLIGAITQLGIRTSAVKDIVANSGAPSAVVVTIKVVRRFGVALGLLGAAVIVGLSGFLSRVSFDDSSHAWAFCVLGVALFFQSITNSSQVVFQGLGRLKALASAGLWGAVGGLLLSLPLYYVMGLDGVVLSIVAYSIALWFPFVVLRRHAKVEALSPQLSLSETWQRGVGFIKVGFFLTISSILGYLVNYLFQSYVNTRFGADSLSLFQAGYTMLWRYAAMLFVSVGYEYYPRLSGVSGSPLRMQAMVNHQSVFTGLLMLPCACLAIAASPMLIRLLYRADFMPMLPYFAIGMAGMMFRPISVSVSYVFLVTGRGATYCITEILSNLVGFVLNVIAFRWFGFVGLGVALIFWMGVDALLMIIFYHRMHLKLNPRVIVITLLYVVVVLGCGVLQIHGYWWIVGLVGLALSVPALRSLRS